jgi:hypothetical protein
MGKPVIRVAKKPYSKPTLTVYGTVRELTQTRGPNGHKDKPGARAPAHTHV